MKSFISNLKKHWQIFAISKSFRVQFITTIIILALILYFLQHFLAYVETRKGAVIDDPILNQFQPVDVTWFTFAFIYLGLITALFFLINHPKQLLMAMTGYGFIVLFRVIAMYSLPLDPPTQMIALEDPFVEFFGSGQTLTRDLFFSGHTSLMFLLYFVINNRTLKYLFLIGTAAIAFCVLIQHVHYTVDVLVALFVAFTSYKIAEKFIRI